MNIRFIYEYANLIERALSFGYKYSFTFDYIEKSLANNLYVQNIEKDNLVLPPKVDSDFIDEIYENSNHDKEDVPVYAECLWAAEAYLRIQSRTKLTFEAIFLILPLSQMYNYFPIYHEMDFEIIISVFLEEFRKKSVFASFLNRYKVSLKEISKYTRICYSTLVSLKSRKRDIKKLNVETTYKIANLLNIRIESLAELEII